MEDLRKFFKSALSMFSWTRIAMKVNRSRNRLKLREPRQQLPKLMMQILVSQLGRLKPEAKLGHPEEVKSIRR